MAPGPWSWKSRVRLILEAAIPPLLVPPFLVLFIKTINIDLDVHDSYCEVFSTVNQNFNNFSYRSQGLWRWHGRINPGWRGSMASWFDRSENYYGSWGTSHSSWFGIDLVLGSRSSDSDDWLFWSTCLIMDVGSSSHFYHALVENFIVAINCSWSCSLTHMSREGNQCIDFLAEWKTND